VGRERLMPGLSRLCAGANTHHLFVLSAEKIETETKRSWKGLTMNENFETKRYLESTDKSAVQINQSGNR